MYRHSVRAFPLCLRLVLFDSGVDFRSDPDSDFGFGPLARRLHSVFGGRGSGRRILVCLGVPFFFDYLEICLDIG